MKKVSLLLFVTLILLLAFAACTANKHEHEFADATCESPAKCSCGVTQGEALGHDMTAATCTAPATCNVCGAVDGAALGHSWRDATCTAPKTCLTCNETEGTPAAHKNDIVLEAKDPTCSATGLTAGVKCSACNTITTEQEVVSKLPHTEAILEAKESTCSEAGLTEGKQCSVCKEILVAQQPTDKKAHTEEILEAKESTCSAKGLTEGLWCTVCEEILVAQEETDKKPHTLETITGTPATCTQDGLTDGSWCTVCETILVPQTVITAAHKNVVDKEYQAPTCTVDGHEAGKYCEECNTIIEGMETLKAPGHDLDDEGMVNNWKAPTCQAPGSYNWVIACWECDYEEITLITINSDTNPANKDLAQLDHVFTNYVYNEDATCYADGTKTAVCDLCKASAEPATDTVPAAGTQREHKEPTTVACGAHWECEYDNCDYVSPDALEHQMVPATCIAYAYCNRNNGCTFVDTEAGYAAHTPGAVVKENIVAPTCLVDGSWDDVTYCTVEGCGVECSRETKVDPALGHNMADATCTAPSTCTRCGHTEGEKRANHKLEMSYENGKVVYSCGAASCEDVKFVIESEGIYFGGNDPSGKNNNMGMVPVGDANKYTEDGKNLFPDVKVDANGNEYYQYYKTAGGDKKQLQFWVPKQANGFSDFSSAASSVGFLSFKINTYADQELLIRLAEGVKTYVGNDGKEQSNWYGSPLGSIPGNVFRIAPVIENNKIVSYNVQSWNKILFNIPVNAEYDGDKLVIDSMYTGWMDVKIGLVMDEETDTIFTYYYINYAGTEYVAFDTAALTTENNKITCAYFNFYGTAEGTGYCFDDLAFGYTKDAEWLFDVCNHNYGTPVVTKPDCENGGYTTAVCAICKFANVYDHTDKLGHDMVNVDAQDSTCIAQGWDAYSYCSRCGDAAAAKEAALLPLSGHTPGEAVQENIVPETCITTGSYDSVVYCAVCKTEELSRTPVTVDEYDGHMNLQVVKGYDSTCYATGLTDGEKCEACGVTTINQNVITKKAHTLVEYGAVTSAKPCETPNVIAGKMCSVEGCDHIEYEPYNDDLAAHTEVAFGAVTSAKPCETPHTLAGTKCSVCDKVIVEPHAAELVPHTYDGDADTNCNVCGYTRSCLHPNKTTIPAVDATCTATGLTAGEKCADCGEITVAQTTTDKLAHTEATLAAKPATCTATGLTAGKECSVCHTVLEAQQTVAKLPHNEVVVPEVLATCTATGLTEGKKCKDCGAVTVEQEVAPALGHRNDIPLAKVDPTCTATGLTAGVKCSRCQVATTPQETIDSLGHNMAAATCYAPSTCTRCDHTEGEAIANHTINATYKDSTLTYACATCSDVFAPANSVVYDGTNVKYELSKNGDMTVSVVDGAYKVQAGEGADRSQYMLYIPGSNTSATFKGFNAENNAFGMISFDLTTNATEPIRFIIMESRYGAGSANLWAGTRGWDDNSMDLIAITPVTESGKITKYNIGGQSFTNKTIATVGVDANGMSEKISIQMGIKITSDMQFMISYYVNGAFYGVYTRDLVNTPVNSNGTMLQRLNDGLLEAVHFSGWTAKNTGFTFDNLFIGYTADAEWMFDACEHVYDNSKVTTVPPTCTFEGYDETKCTLCGYGKRENIVPANGHTATPSCMEEAICSVCNVKVYDPLNHNIEQKLVSGVVGYACTRCDATYTNKNEQVYFDGSSHTGMSPSTMKDKYTTVSGTDKPEVVTDTNGNQYYKIVKLNDTTGSYQATEQGQIWLPYHPTTTGRNDHFANFTNGSGGTLSFDINYGMDQKMEMYLVSGAPSSGWGSTAGRITTPVFLIDKLETKTVDGKNVNYVTVKGFGTVLGTLDYSEDDILTKYGSTGWFNVTIGLNVSGSKVTAHYYIDGEYKASVTVDLTTEAQALAYVYINMYTQKKDSGLLLDNLTFGYTAGEHWTLDGKEHKITDATACNVPATCSCGWVGLGLDHDLIPATCQAPATCKDCGAQVGTEASHTLNTTYSNGVLTYGCTTCSNTVNIDTTDSNKSVYLDGTANMTTQVSLSNEGTNFISNVPLEGGYYDFLQKVEGTGKQGQIWIKQYAKGLTGFTADNGGVGFFSASFNLNLSTTNGTTDQLVIKLVESHTQVKDGNTVISGYHWDSPEGCIKTEAFVFKPVVENGVTTGYTITVWDNSKTISTEAGSQWSGWFDIAAAIELDKATDKVILHYYLNGEYWCTASRELTTASNSLTSVYMNLNTHAQGRGYYLDNLAFGYTTNGHYAFDGDDVEHVMTKGGCTDKDSCSCGWKSSVVGSHNWTGTATCAKGQICSNCGAEGEKLTNHNWTGTATCTQGQICSVCNAEGTRLSHVISTSVASSKPTYGCANCTRTFVPGVYVSGDGSSTDYIQSTGGTANLLTTATEGGNSYYSVIATSDTAVKEWTWLNATGDAAINRLSGFSCANNSSGVISFKLNLQGISSTLGIRPAYGRNSSQWTDIDGNGDAWNDNTFYLMTIQAASSGTTRNITSNYGTVGTVNINEWIDFVITIQLHNDGTMSLDYYINGVLALSVDKVAMMNSGKISSVEFELQNATTGNGYYLDDFAIGYSNDAHWTLDGKDHSVVEGAKATCESGIMCSCGNQIGAALGHNIDTAATYDAANHKVVYSCERAGCTHTIEMTGYYNDGTNKDNLTDTKAAYTATANVGDGYYTLLQNDASSIQFEIWTPINGHPDYMKDFSCANNAFGILAFKINAYTTKAFTMQAVSHRNVSGEWGWANSNEIFGISGVSNGTVNLTGLSDKQNSNRSTLKSIAVTDNWTGWLDVVITLQLTSNGKVAATYYVNGENIGTITRTVQAKQCFTAVYISGNSDVVGSGIMLDDFSFAYTVPKN